MSDSANSKSAGRSSIYAIIGLLLLVALLSGGAYLWFGRTVPANSEAPLEKVRFSVLFYTGSCSVMAAQEKGYFLSEGIQATTDVYGSGTAVLDQVFSGKADLGASGDIPVMFAVMNHQPLSVVATIVEGENVVGIVARKDRGITTPDSLKGKRIGVTVATAGHFFLNVFLTRQKLYTRDVTLRNLKTEELSDALANDEIDAASTWEPMLGTLQARLGNNGVTLLAKNVYSPTLNLVGTQSYVAGHAQTLQKVLRALIQGEDFCRDNPSEARELVAGYLKVDALSLAPSWPAYRFRVSLDQSLLLQLEDETRWAIKNKLSDRTDMPNYLDHLDMDPLQAVAPAAVTVIH